MKILSIEGILLLTIFWVVPSIVVGYAASRKGRNGIGYFLISLIISPLPIGAFIFFFAKDLMPEHFKDDNHNE